MKQFTNALTDAIKTRFPGATCVFNGHKDRYDIVIDGVEHELKAAEVARIKIYMAEELAVAYDVGRKVRK